jgi:hypothetical protein
VPVITREPIDAYAHCMQQQRPGVPCEGHAQQPVPGIRETVAYSYRDNWGTGGPAPSAEDMAFANLTERETIRICFADDADRPCPHCGAAREIADQVRPKYPALSGVPQDELMRRQRLAEENATQTVSAAERQAAALEALAAQGAQAGENEQLRALVERQSEQIERLLARLENGNGEPKRRTASKT